MFFFFFDNDSKTTVPIKDAKGVLENKQEFKFVNERTIWHNNKEYCCVLDMCENYGCNIEPSLLLHGIKKYLNEYYFEIYDSLVCLPLKTNNNEIISTDFIDAEMKNSFILIFHSFATDKAKQTLLLNAQNELSEAAASEDVMEPTTEDLETEYKISGIFT